MLMLLSTVAVSDELTPAPSMPPPVTSVTLSLPVTMLVASIVILPGFTIVSLPAVICVFLPILMVATPPSEIWLLAPTPLMPPPAPALALGPDPTSLKALVAVIVRSAAQSATSQWPGLVPLIAMVLLVPMPAVTTEFAVWVDAAPLAPIIAACPVLALVV